MSWMWKYIYSIFLNLQDNFSLPRFFHLCLKFHHSENGKGKREKFRYRFIHLRYASTLGMQLLGFDFTFVPISLCKYVISTKTLNDLNISDTPFYVEVIWILIMGLKNNDMKYWMTLCCCHFFFISCSVYLNNVNFIFNMKKYMKVTQWCFFIHTSYEFKVWVLKGVISKFQ